MLDGFRIPSAVNSELLEELVNIEAVGSRSPFKPRPLGSSYFQVCNPPCYDHVFQWEYHVHTPVYGYLPIPDLQAPGPLLSTHVNIDDLKSRNLQLGQVVVLWLIAATFV